MAGSKNRKTSVLLLTEIGCMVLAVAGMSGLVLGEFVKLGVDYMSAYIVFVVLGIGIVGFGIRRGILLGDLDYDNCEHPGRFWLCFLIGLVVSFACVFLPAAAWPFLPVYIVLSLFGNFPLGVLGATVLLVIPVCMTQSGIEIFLLYLISGFFGVTLFKKLENGFRMGIPFVLALGGLLVCEAAGTVLVVNAKPGPEYFVIPAINMIVSGIMILGILKFFSSKVVYKYRESYLDLNDPENSILGALKQTDRKSYMKSIHTAYFCERIAGKLGLDTDALKCAGYYHSMGEALTDIYEMHPFPPKAWEILEEYRAKGKPILHKETAVLIASENIVSAILMLFEKADGSRVDYDKVIDSIFKRYQDAGSFRQCDISMKEFYMMQKIFKEEKLYYDFLH